VNLTLEPGHVYALTGPSGSGKSTLLGILAGWIEPSEGSVERVGADRIGWVFQSPHGVAGRAAIDHVALPLLARGSSVAASLDDAAEILDRFGLADRAQSPFRDLSGGEGQRLMLARGLAASPELFLVDEPTAQLDSETSKNVSSSIGALASENTIIVVATHDDRTRDACTDHIDLRDYSL
jgi:lipoprotein-releasing system ATP-binding protein